MLVTRTKKNYLTYGQNWSPSAVMWINIPLTQDINWTYITCSENVLPFLHPLKMSENLWLSDVFRGYRNGWTFYERLMCVQFTSSVLLILRLIIKLSDYFNLNLQQRQRVWKYGSSFPQLSLGISEIRKALIRTC